jgi:hypothetical protein
MKISFFKNRFFFALTPSINIYKGGWLIEISWIYYSVNIKINI